MFEDSTFESSGRIQTRSRAWSIATLALNTTILGALIVIPLIYPEALPSHLMNMLLVAPAPPPAEPKPVQVKPTQAFHGMREFTDLGLTVPRQIPTSIRVLSRVEAEPIGNAIPGLEQGNGFPADNPFGRGTESQPRVVSAVPKGPQRVSTGIANGLLLDRVQPVYPPIARAARVQGTVVLEATISTSGTIVNLRVLSGNPMLQQVAIDAVSRWRYRPYLLNGQPVEVQTTVNIEFNLGR